MSKYYYKGYDLADVLHQGATETNVTHQGTVVFTNFPGGHSNFNSNVDFRPTEYGVFTYDGGTDPLSGRFARYTEYGAGRIENLQFPKITNLSSQTINPTKMSVILLSGGGGGGGGGAGHLRPDNDSTHGSGGGGGSAGNLVRVHNIPISEFTSNGGSINGLFVGRGGGGGAGGNDEPGHGQPGQGGQDGQITQLELTSTRHFEVIGGKAGNGGGGGTQHNAPIGGDYNTGLANSNPTPALDVYEITGSIPRSSLQFEVGSTGNNGNEVNWDNAGIETAEHGSGGALNHVGLIPTTMYQAGKSGTKIYSLGEDGEDQQVTQILNVDDNGDVVPNPTVYVFSGSGGDKGVRNDYSPRVQETGSPEAYISGRQGLDGVAGHNGAARIYWIYEF